MTVRNPILTNLPPHLEWHDDGWSQSALGILVGGRCWLMQTLSRAAGEREGGGSSDEATTCQVSPSPQSRPKRPEQQSTPPGRQGSTGQKRGVRPNQDRNWLGTVHVLLSADERAFKKTRYNDSAQKRDGGGDGNERMRRNYIVTISFNASLHFFLLVLRAVWGAIRQEERTKKCTRQRPANMIRMYIF